jgi:type IV pilus assembly protein PilB
MQKKLGDMLVDEGVLSLDKLKEALERQKESGKRLGEVIIEMQLAVEEEVMDILAKQLGIEKIDLYETHIDLGAAKLITPDMIQRHQAFPIKIDGSHLVVAMVDPLNLLAIDDIRLSTGYEVSPRIASPHALKFAFDKFFGVSHEAAKSLEEFRQDQINKGFVIDDSLIDKATLAEVEQAPIVKLVETILNGAVDYKASDIHLEPKEDRMDVRYRVDGMLQRILTVPRTAIPAVTARLKILARLDTSERRKPQDGRINVIIRDLEIDIRFSTLPTVFGEKIVMRLLNKSSALLTLKDLGFDVDELPVFEEMVLQPHGIVLITGPTGSGKSTTLIAALDKIANETNNVVTMEDPVEYLLPKINQVHVNHKVGLSFATGLRTIMRQDPDIIMVGEIRDPETAELAVQAALTGHLVFSTLHTNDAPGAIPRLVNMKVPPYLINATVSGIMAQRLLRKLCAQCKKSYEPTEEELEIIASAYDLSTLDKKPIVYKARGCKFCNHVGYKGRTGIFEIFRMTNRLRELIVRDTGIHAVKALARQEGMQTLFESGIKKILKGETSMEELMRVARPDYETEEMGYEPAAAVRAGQLREAAPKLAEVETNI